MGGKSFLLRYGEGFNKGAVNPHYFLFSLPSSVGDVEDSFLRRLEAYFSGKCILFLEIRKATSPPPPSLFPIAFKLSLIIGDKKITTQSSQSFTKFIPH